uniref:Putative treble-clef zinc-finger domain-containing protein n=1 Tax=Mola mola TaxID=94237 RepID=A0A3Q3W3Y9_MOLML
SEPKSNAKHRKTTTPAFLSNLGRATLRGIRRCPQCGIYNGTRGLKDGGGVLASGLGGGVQVFSVCHRGRGATATQLGFVELVPTDTAIATGDGATLLTRINLGRCFVPSCRQGQSLCIHIKQAIECQSCATPLTLKSSVLEGLQASIQAREELWRLATESPGPLVQRVAKNTLVVKCHTDSQHPLGLLHLTVSAGGLSEGSKGERRGREQQHGVFHCACQLSSRKSKAGVDGAGGTNGSCPPPGSVTSQPCLHFYACVCAFASDEKLASEFAPFIKYSSSGTVTEPVVSLSKYFKVVGVSASGLKKTGQRKAPGQIFAVLTSFLCVHVAGSVQAVEECTVTMGFQQWLASVTERIHQTMHYQSEGKPQPLVYHIPQEFFNALQQRLSLGSKKKRLPNLTTAFVRNDGSPPGSLSKYTWHITNQMQVKRIFDTPELPLELFQSFVRNIDGSYSRFRCPDPPPEPELPEGHRTDRPQAIRPMELRTFLKVGAGSADLKEAGPFVIEWIPDVLPRCHMGELRISFEFGHQQSGQLEHCERGSRIKPDLSQSKAATKVEILQVIV